MTETVRNIYQLSGGGKVTVLKPFGAGVYAALVEQKGRYPDAGKIARNRGRKEYSYILDGSFEYEIDGKKTTLNQGDSILVGDGQGYTINGSGRVLVIVSDTENGATEMEVGGG